MSRKNTLRAAVLALVLLLASPAAWAAGPVALPGPVDFLQGAWSWLTGMWSLDTLDHRCGIDPDGGACTTTQADARGCIDPNGGACAPQEIQADHRICIDPNGGTCAQ
jgi:hypothetical protein